MSAMASLHDRGDDAPHDAQHRDYWDILETVDGIIGAGADVNVVDNVSYRQAPYYNN